MLSETDLAFMQIQLKSLAEEMQALIKGLEKLKQELAASENDGPVSEVFRKVYRLVIFSLMFSMLYKRAYHPIFFYLFFFLILRGCLTFYIYFFCTFFYC